jgi:K+-transporting ATPase ATPase C chain
MKKEIISSLILTFVCIVFFSGVYPLIICGIAQFAPNKGEGFTVRGINGKEYYENIAQSFTKDNYFWSRPSAVGYAANGSGGSNKGPANPDFLKQVQDRIDTFLVHNPGVKVADIPVDMVTASGSGLDPHISIQGAMVQVTRVAKARGLDSRKVEALVQRHIDKPVYGLGPERINVLKLNIDLETLK